MLGTEMPPMPAMMLLQSDTLKDLGLEVRRLAHHLLSVAPQTSPLAFLSLSLPPEDSEGLEAGAFRSIQPGCTRTLGLEWPM